MAVRPLARKIRRSSVKSKRLGLVAAGRRLTLAGPSW